MGSYRPRVVLAEFLRPNQSAIDGWGWDFHTVQGGVDPGGVVYLWISNSERGPYRPLLALALFSTPNQSAIGR